MTTQKNTPNAPEGGRTRSAQKPRRSVLDAYERALSHHRAGRLEEAVREYARALRTAPSAEIYNNLGVALRTLGRAHGATACYRRALALKPDMAALYTNLGNALRDLGNTARAIEAHRRAIKYAPNSPQTLFNGALALRADGQAKAALDFFNAALKIERGYTACRVERAITLLQLGDWARAFKELESRFALPGRDPRRKGVKMWDGSGLKDTTILVNYEGNEGAVVQFSRFATALKHMGARVILECPEHLTHLFAAAPDIDATILPKAPIANVDVQIPLFSLPSRLTPAANTLAGQVPYLPIPKSTVAPLRILPHTRLAVGLAWTGTQSERASETPSRAYDVSKNMPLEDFGEILGIPSIQFFSLEQPPGTGEIESLGLQPLIETADASIMDVANLANVIGQLDMVICVESSLCAHVAGALGKPVWVLAGPQADWCWLMDRDDSPWYPSLRLFRHTSAHSWSDSVSTIRRALINVLAQGGD